VPGPGIAAVYGKIFDLFGRQTAGNLRLRCIHRYRHAGNFDHCGRGAEFQFRVDDRDHVNQDVRRDFGGLKTWRFHADDVRTGNE
jgi:hypothetical protein